MSGLSPEIKDQLKEFGTCAVSDALDRLGIPGGLHGIRPIVQGVSMCGPAFTVHYVPCGENKGTVGDFLDDVHPGEVVVIDNAGRVYCTVWGGLMSVSASLRKLEGTIIDGVCRDVSVIYKENYPIFTKGTYMVTGKDRVEVDAINTKVAVSGTQVKPGDIILADDTGALVIPLERLDEVFFIAKEIADKENQIMGQIVQGKTLRDARSSVAYHQLQTRK